MTPTPIQRWISRSYFGKDPGIMWDSRRDDMFKKGDWQTDFEALQQSITKAQEAAAKQPQQKAVGAK